jgi:hypothetical protein
MPTKSPESIANPQGSTLLGNPGHWPWLFSVGVIVFRGDWDRALRMGSLYRS